MFKIIWNYSATHVINIKRIFLLHIQGIQFNNLRFDFEVTLNMFQLTVCVVYIYFNVTHNRRGIIKVIN